MAQSTPGVFIQEVSLLPPSVAAVATAIPAFIGYTQTVPPDENGETPEGLVVKRIDTFKEFTDSFGGVFPALFQVVIDAARTITGVSRQIAGQDDNPPEPANIHHPYLLYYSLKLYFANGGGSCYIVSVGRYGQSIDQEELISGLNAIESIDEVTLILSPDATNLPENGYIPFYQEALLQCADLKDRFCIMDVAIDDEDATVFRNSMGPNNLKYGAAYAPHLRTRINYEYEETGVSIASLHYAQTDDNGLGFVFQGDTAQPITLQADGDELAFEVDGNGALTISGLGDEGTLAASIINAWRTQAETLRTTYELSISGDGTALVTASTIEVDAFTNVTLSNLRNFLTQLYNQIKGELVKQKVILPPSGAIAGVYAGVDRTRGVWKAPANVGLNSVEDLTIHYNNLQQGRLNIDPVGGKSINGIRAFAGRGILVWGARTLAGNDNEWRYINVRRLFNFIEESVQKATAFAVFESNTAGTWLKVKGMIESFLSKLHGQGALAGATAEDAYFVNVGLGKTMTSQDILEGRMIVEIGIAAVRPAEFIILRFSHKLQES